MKKSVFLLFLLLSMCFSFAQDEGAVKKDKFFAGGSFGLSLGRYTLINLSPQVGYRFNRFVAAGLGFNLQYASLKERYNGRDYSKTSQGITGLNAFGRFYPVDRFFVQVQPEGNYIFGNIKYYQPEQTFKLDAEIVPCFLAGGGYSAPAGKGRVLITVLYDLIQQPNSPYGNQPIVNVGYNVNF